MYAYWDVARVSMIYLSLCFSHTPESVLLHRLLAGLLINYFIYHWRILL